MTRAERLFCDTNVLLTAVDRRRARSRQAIRVLNELPNEGTELCISGQIVREFLSVATRPLEANGMARASSRRAASLA